jgi:hypothetical protein
MSMMQAIKKDEDIQPVWAKSHIIILGNVEDSTMCGQVAKFKHHQSYKRRAIGCSKPPTLTWASHRSKVIARILSATPYCYPMTRHSLYYDHPQDDPSANKINFMGEVDWFLTLEVL